MYRRGVLIYNPTAGRGIGRRERTIDKALGALAGRVETIERRATAGPGSATELARAACRAGADLVLVCGGDGTIHEVVNGLAHTATPLAVLPAGTANVLAREVGLPCDVVRAAELLPRLVEQRIGLGRICRPGSTPCYFLLMAGVGLDARIVYGLNLRWKARLGVLAYWLAGFAQVGQRLEVFEAAIDGERYTCTFALVTHARNYGGNLHIARHVHLLDEDLEVVLFHTRSTLRYALYLAGVVSGTLHRLRGVTFLRARQAAMTALEPGAAHVEADGEYIGRLPATIEIVPNALTLLLPASYLQTHG